MRFLQFSWLFLLVLLWILFDANNNSWVHGQRRQCLNDQRALLLQLNQSLTFFSSFAFSVTPSKLRSWSSNTDCCSSWDGVECDGAGHVISLDLSNEFILEGLDNTSTLYRLQYLERLNLAFNSFKSTPIPSGFDRLANLTYLNLSNSGFNGQIPIHIARLTRLVTLDLSTFFPGSIPLMLSDPDLGTLTRNLTELRELWLDGVNISADGTKWCKDLSSSLPKLQVLSLSNCQLSGPFDASLLQLRSLYELRLDQNNISAEVPQFFGNFSNLTSLHLSSCELYGTFPERILQIRTLQNLYLSDNKRLYGSLPEFPKDGLLQTLVLSGTSFSGEIPNSIGNLGHLSRLKLDNCRFNGSIPDSIANLNQLQYIELSSNNFTGSIPQMPWSESLIEIEFAHNRLTGPIPSQWNKLMRLINLNLKNNSLSGTIPPFLFTLPLLQKLDLFQNQFTGPLRGFNASSSLLDTLDLSNNNLEGSIPTSLFQLSRLKILILSSSNFNGTINLDNFFQNFKNLSSLDLSSNSLVVNTPGTNAALFPKVGTLKLRSCNLTEFPNFLRNQSTLNQLDLSHNQIQGKIPNWIWTIGNGTLNQLNLSHNFLEDPDQPLPGNSFKRLTVLDLRSNMLQGKNLILPPSATVLDYSYNNITSIIPTNISLYLLVAIFFSLSNNNITGGIPESICQAGYLQVLDLSNNNLTGTIPSCLGAIRGLRVLNLRGNNLYGTMPHTFPGNCSLRTLDFNGNRLEGQVARSLANCTMLEVLDLGNNQFDGTFPSWLGNMSQLRVMVLRANKFHGPLGNPGTGHNFPMLQIIDISSNKFTGTLSNECFSSWQAMMTNDEEDESNHRRMILGFGFLELSHLYYQDAVTVTSKGLDMELVKILTIFTSIDFSNNNFEGEIPEIIGRLRSLYVLNFSRNALTGTIPSSIGNLTQLESLDLSQNQLTGEIPTQLAGLTFLAVLNLSFNKLVGKIPYGQQFQTFNGTAFEGNDGLCGVPLSRNCSDTPESPHTHADKDEVDWQFILTGLGFGGGLGMIIGPLLFWKKGREWYNEHINRILSMIFPGLFHIHCDDGRVEADDSIEEELTEMTGDYDDDRDEEDEEWFKGHYCVFCTKLDMSRRKAIHNPNCTCYTSPLNSS